MLVVNNVSKLYGKKKVLTDVNFTLHDNQITVLVGQNGAGKSTMIKCIVGFLNFDGVIELDGKNHQDLDVKRQIGYVPEVPELYNELTVQQHFDFIAHAYNIKDYEKLVEKYLNIFELTNKKGELCGTLSKGMRQKVSIICALILKPRVLIVDEPMIGLDPNAIRELNRIFIELKQECSIFISTHLLSSVEQLWDQVLIMNSGNIVFKSNKVDFENTNQTLEEVYFAHHNGNLEVSEGDNNETI